MQKLWTVLFQEDPDARTLGVPKQSAVLVSSCMMYILLVTHILERTLDCLVSVL